MSAAACARPGWTSAPSGSTRLSQPRGLIRTVSGWCSGMPPESQSSAPLSTNAKA